MMCWLDAGEVGGRSFMLVRIKSEAGRWEFTRARRTSMARKFGTFSDIRICRSWDERERTNGEQWSVSNGVREQNITLVLGLGLTSDFRNCLEDSFKRR